MFALKNSLSDSYWLCPIRRRGCLEVVRQVISKTWKMVLVFPLLGIHHSEADTNLWVYCYWAEKHGIWSISHLCKKMDDFNCLHRDYLQILSILLCAAHIDKQSSKYSRQSSKMPRRFHISIFTKTIWIFTYVKYDSDSIYYIDKTGISLNPRRFLSSRRCPCL